MWRKKHKLSLICLHDAVWVRSEGEKPREAVTQSSGIRMGRRCPAKTDSCNVRALRFAFSSGRGRQREAV